MDKITDKVYNFKTKNKEGFISNEIDILLKDYPNININKFNEALMGITGILKDGEFVYFHSDIIKALSCGVENRDLQSWEWD